MKTKTTWRREGTSEDTRYEHPGAGEQAGAAVGGIGGTLAGAAIGSAAGPVGTLIGGIAGALGGWWAGEKAGRAAEDMNDHDEFYRGHYDQNRHDAFEYDTARMGYGVGHVAARIAKEPEKYGFEHVVPLEPLQWDEVNAASGTSLIELADAAGVGVDEIEALNPFLRRDRTPSRDGYAIRVPHGAGLRVAHALRGDMTDDGARLGE